MRKASEMIAANADIAAQPAHPCVSRGGVKLAGALEHYPIDVEDHVCLDVGASTGGFTEVLLRERRAARVRRRCRPRPVASERCASTARSSRWKRPISASSTASGCRQRPDVVVIDVSFISLKRGAAGRAGAGRRADASAGADQAAIRGGRAALSRRASCATRRCISAVCDDIAAFAASLGCTDIEIFPSPIAGGDGNREFFLGARRG